jgi:hypothetical protein
MKSSMLKKQREDEIYKLLGEILSKERKKEATSFRHPKMQLSNFSSYPRRRPVKLCRQPSVPSWQAFPLLFLLTEYPRKPRMRALFAAASGTAKPRCWAAR